MKTQIEAVDGMYDELYSLYGKVFGPMWLETKDKTWSFDIEKYEGGEKYEGANPVQDIIRSSDGMIEIMVEQTNSICRRTAWKYTVYAVYNDDIGEMYEYNYRNTAAQKFMEIQLSMKFSVANNK
jgi:hypothetical protein